MITSIRGASASTDVAALQSTQSTGRSHGKGPFDAVSGLLGMSAGDIASAVSSGKSLDDLAKDKGVSHEDLVAALEAGAPQELQGTARLNAMVEDIASHSGRGGGPGGPGGRGGPPPGPPPGAANGVLSGDLTATQQGVLDQLSTLLDTTSTELATSLRSGTSLAQLLDDKGVSLDRLATTLQSGFLVDTRY
jgi:hypothetical protein